LAKQQFEFELFPGEPNLDAEGCDAVRLIT